MLVKLSTSFCKLFLFISVSLKSHLKLWSNSFILTGHMAACVIFLMPSLQAVVCVCGLAAAAVWVIFSALACVTGWWTEISCSISTIASCSTYRIGDRCQFWAASSCTTAWKQAFQFHYIALLGKLKVAHFIVQTFAGDFSVSHDRVEF